MSVRQSLFFAVLAAAICLPTAGEAQPLAPRLMLAIDTSGSMIRDFDSVWTYGDGVMDGCSEFGTPADRYFCGTGCTAGNDNDGNGVADDSRIFIARNAMTNIVLSYGDVEWGLARFEQDTGAGINCYNDIQGDRCDATAPNPPNFAAPCLNYEGEFTCPGNGADILVGFSPFAPFNGDTDVQTNALLSWIDNTETAYNSSTTTGNFCNAAAGNNCEVRPHGGTPIAGTLTDIGTYIAPIRAADTRPCRPYAVVLITDGGESCGGDPEAAATALRLAGVQTYVIGLAAGTGLRATLNGIATAGGTDAGAVGGDTAFFADNPNELSAGLAEIVRRSLLTEECEGTDEDCDGLIDEGFTKFCSDPSDPGTLDLCMSPGDICDGVDSDCDGMIDEGTLNACGTCGPVPEEICDGIDNNCNTVIDEGGVCTGCTPSPEVCNDMDDDCDGDVDEDIMISCGTDVGECTRGFRTCTAGVLSGCSGQGPVAELCNNLDDDCDGVIDGNTRSCGISTGACEPGVQICTAGMFSTDCIGEIGPSPEICDGIDNNCAGGVDEGNPGGGGTCGSSLGECSPGTLSCVGGMLECTGGTGPVAETCNNNDDDCDGATDEEVPTMGACGSTTGECRAGVRTCIMGSFQCQGARGPSDELCDSRDNDCDGDTDEGNPGGGADCGTAVGICELGSTQCIDGALACTGGRGGSGETCDLIDNDCDGLIDEGNPDGGGRCGMTDEGTCDFGAEVCVAGALECRGETGPGVEICDGLDNDCDGDIDEGDPEGGDACGDDTGECTAGRTRCVAGELICDGGTGPTPEICDGLDNDCDGVEDEGIGVGAPCGSDVGECSPGVNICRDGGLVCDGEIGPTDERCDNLDNDCDAVIDEALPAGAACGSMEGLCMEGALQCIDGEDVCVGEVPPGRETCDCEDNDCDAEIDEDAESLCPEGSACVECGCSSACAVSEFGFDCPTGKTPFLPGGPGTDECFCVTPRCEEEACAGETVERDEMTLCSPDEDSPDCTCKNNACTFPCEGVVCAGGTVCRPDTGRCVEDSCRGLGCGMDEVCDVATGACVEDPCSTVECGPGEACRDGVCQGSCAGVECDSGEVCRAGSCIMDPCAGVLCPEGQACNELDGMCIDDMCVGVRCPSGSVCDPLTGDCEADPCDTVTCPEDQVCSDGECFDDVPMPDAGRPDSGADAGPDGGRVGDRVLASGGGGCACDAAGGAPSQDPRNFGLALAFLLFMGWRRRKSLRVRAVARSASVAAAGAALLMSGGCDVDPFCLTCADTEVPDAADAGRDTGRPDVTRPDTGSGDTGGDGGDADDGGDACLPAELCNEIDDDCDGEVDEDIDFMEDIRNCGGCGVDCAPPGAFGTCIAGECNIGSCDVGFVDLDGELENGCEYRCLPSEDDDAVCDLRDDDCDGEVDEDVALETDPTNCGSCGRNCRFAHVTSPRCEESACTFDRETDCEDGFFDVNEVVDDGCEYACILADPAVETCNGRDDDCDGEVDEGDPGGGASCGSDMGSCSMGTEACVAGVIACVGSTDPDTESCNGDDDDCDGRTDERNPGGGRLCGESVGACVLGREVCTMGVLECQDDVGPTDEICDGLDQDCDGSIDEGNPGGGAACGEDRGICTAGVQECTGGVLVCTGAVGGRDEICNGLDDNCDGSTDEGNPGGGGSCGTDVGACLPGTRVCMGGRLECDGATSGGAELCNAIDDDCDGSVDEGDPEGGAECGPTTGECSAGTQRCLGGTLTCRGGVGPAPEECDGRDNNCNGRTDETFDFLNDLNNCRGCGVVCSFPNGFAVCGATGCELSGCEAGFVDEDGIAGNGCEYACTFAGAEGCNGVDDDCDTRIDEGVVPPPNFCNANGVCAGTAAVCSGAAGFTCTYPGTFEETETRCDGSDNDCDGVTDEAFPTLGDLCSNGVGACQNFGVFECDGVADIRCNAAPAGDPDPEECNGIDDNCDGMIDNNVGSSIPVVTIPRFGGGTVDVMQYEASRPDATSTDAGDTDFSGLACSNPGVLPWTNVTWAQARDSCEAIGTGWGLCAEEDWQIACEGPAPTDCEWSYSTTTTCVMSHPDFCNGDEYDSSGAAGDQDEVATTGQMGGEPFRRCYTNWGAGVTNRVYDLSGNVKEWTSSERGSSNVHAIRGGSYNNVEAGRSCGFDFTVGDEQFAFVNTGFRCCRY